MTPKPKALALRTVGIPQELKDIPRWVAWKYLWKADRQKWDKVPLCAKGRAKTNAPSTWAAFEEACAISGDGVGFVFNGDGLIGIDFDHAIDADGVYSQTLLDAMATIEGYWELSPSGHGAHCITRGQIDKAHVDGGIEVYKTGRFFTVTGHTLKEFVGLDGAKGLTAFVAKHFGDGDAAKVVTTQGPEHRAVQNQPSATHVVTAVEGNTKSYFRTVNEAALVAPEAWVPALFGGAAVQKGDTWRIPAVALDREREEDISIHPKGIIDYAVADMEEVDGRQGKRTAIDLVMEWTKTDANPFGMDAREAAGWLCDKLGVTKDEMGFAGGLPFALHEKTGQILATLQNLDLALGNDAFLGARIAEDLFTTDRMIAPPGTNDWREYKDTDGVKLRLGLQRKGFARIAKQDMDEMLAVIAERNAFDSAQLWLLGLRWDGVGRVDTFFERYMGAAGSAYGRAVGAYLWTALAGRVMDPGCQADMAPILVGLQGIRKTSAAAALVPDPRYFAEVDLNARDGDTSRLLRGKLVGELAELKGLNSRDGDSIKAFITRRWEEWIPKYREYAVRFPRRLVFIGTTNEDEFLADATGNRRWLPIRCGRVRLEALRADLEQLWAEGRDRWQVMGIEYQDAERLASAEYSQFMISDSLEDSVQEWLDAIPEAFDVGEKQPIPRKLQFFRLSDLLAHLNQKHKLKADRSTDMRVAKILKTMQFERKQCMIGGVKAIWWSKFHTFD
jgi:predicted P-loop ATPase